jgi:glycosyltransferase involved in cell wall biosynthesis
MKILLLAGTSSIHTIRWANGLSSAGHEVHVITQHPILEPLSAEVKVHSIPFHGALGYFLMVPQVSRLLQSIQPDIVNAHYASGYGTTARLVNYHPWVLSVWGSDVYDFPYKSPVHRYLVKKNILAADCVASTSFCMAKQVRSLTSSAMEIPITPFGVDMTVYDSMKQLSPEPSKPIVIGTVKTMAPKYGISTLLKAFALLLEKLRYQKSSLADRLQLRLVGDGPQLDELKDLAKDLGIDTLTHFVGRVPHAQVPEELSKLDIYVALSESESFGVAIIEAGAAARPVVVSDAGGLPEVTIDGVTGFVVPRNHPQASADAIEKLVLDPQLCHRMGLAGRNHVEEHYRWSDCITKMVKVYQSVLQ